MKKIIVFYATYGGGHLSAARSIKEYIETNYKDIASVELVDCMSYINEFINNLTTKAYKEIAKKSPKTWGRIYKKSEKGILAKLSTDSNKIMSKKLNKLLLKECPDLIISTHPFSSQMCAYLKKQGKLNSKLATVLTDHASHDQWLVFNEYTDFFFVSNNEMKNELKKKGIPSKKIYATGIPIASKFLLKYDKSQILKELKFSENKKTILFFGGGEFGLGKSQTINIFKSFLSSEQNIQIIAISGKNKKMKKEFINIVNDSNKQDSVKILEFTNNVAEFMSISDLVVTKPGGLTTTESLVSGVPLILINPLPGQEEENARFLEKNQVAIWIKKNDDASKILNRLLSDSDKLQDIKKNIGILAKRNSTKDICKILLVENL